MSVTDIHSEGSVQNPPPQGRRERSRRELAAVAIRLFEAQGFAATTAEQIAHEAGYTERTFFRHFETKEDVVFFDLPDILEPLEALRDHGTEGRAWDSIRAIVVENAGQWEAARAELGLARTRLFHTEPALYRRFLEISSEWEAVIAQIVAAERGADSATDVYSQMVASAIVGACRTSFRVWLAGATGTVVDHLDAALKVVARGARRG